MLGITQKTLAAWRGEPVTADDVRALTREEACEIYRANYWNAMKCDELPRGIDLMVFDFGVNAGPATSVKMLQRAVGSKPDGAVGDFTLRAVRATEPRALLEALARARLDFYRKLDTWETFGRGWENRVNEVRRQALLMVAA
jgi:lysozyme family protein